MPSNISIKTLSQNAQFQQFVQFAETTIAAGKQKAIARVETSEVGGIANRTIKPATGDWVGIGVGRLSSLKKANNTTRDAFLKAVSDMFGGQDHIPESVQAAMKMEDYGKGKPLTARRIMAVKEAIVQILTEENKAVKEANEKLHTGMQSCDQISKSGMPAEFAEELRKILTEAQRRYIGEPSGEPTPIDFVRGGAQKLISEMVKTANAEGHRITVKEFSDAMKPFYERHVAAASIQGLLDKLTTEMGQTKCNPHIITKRHPEILDDLLACKSPDEVKVCFEKHKEPSTDVLKLRGELHKYENEFISMVEKAINDGTGHDDIRFNFSNRSTQRSAFLAKMQNFSSSILTNENEDAKKLGWSLEAAVKQLADEAASGFIARIKEIDKFVSSGEISENLGKTWRDELVFSANAKSFSPEKIMAMSKKLDPQTLIDGFKPGNDIKAILNSVGDFAKQIETIGEDAYGFDDWHNGSVDGKNEVRLRIMQVLFEKNPGMKDALMARAKEVKENMDSLLVGVPSKTGTTTVKTRNENWQLCFVIFGEPVQKKEAVQA